MPKAPFDPESRPDLPFDPRDLPDPDFRAPDAVGLALGWRAWGTPIRLPRFGVAAKLFSVTWRDYYWVPRQHGVARCEKCGDDVPGEDCSCGFYCAKTREHLESLGYEWGKIREDGRVCIMGEVANWGKVIEGTQGWRAQKAYPVRLYVPFEARHLVRPLRESYGVPVLLRTALDKNRILNQTEGGSPRWI